MSYKAPEGRFKSKVHDITKTRDERGEGTRFFLELDIKDPVKRYMAAITFRPSDTEILIPVLDGGDRGSSDTEGIDDVLRELYKESLIDTLTDIKNTSVTPAGRDSLRQSNI